MPDNHTRYLQVLSSPALGGAEKLGLAIHQFVSAARPGTSAVLVPRSGATRTSAAALGTEPLTFDVNALSSRTFARSALANLQLLLRVGRRRGRVVHVHSPFTYGAMRPMFIGSRARRIVHIHLDYSDEQLTWCLKLRPHLVITCGRFIEARIRRILDGGGALDTRVVPILNAIDTQVFTPGDRAAAKAAYGVAVDRPLLLVAANLSSHKGQDTAIRALHLLRERGQSPLLWLAGEQRDGGGDEAARLTGLARSFGVADSCTLLGFRKDMATLFRAADFLLLPSTQEGLPLSILEAQASGTVVLAAPTAGVPELIEDGRSGFLIAASDAEAYAARLEDLIRQPAFRETVAAAALASVRSRFTFDRYGAQVLAEYDRLLGSS